MLKGHVFLYQIFGNEICAKVFDTVSFHKTGIFKDYGDEMEVTYSGSDISISSGVAMIGGRPVQETSSTTLDAGTNTLFCKLVLTIDLDQNNTQSNFNQGFYEILTNGADYPTVTQDDIVNNNSGKYQFELAQFTTGLNGIDNFEDLRTFINLQEMLGIPTNGIIGYDGSTIPSGFEETDGPNDYFTTEKVIGKWIGKPLYRRVIEIPINSDNANITVDINALNIDTLVNLTGTTYYDGSVGQATIKYRRNLFNAYAYGSTSVSEYSGAYISGTNLTFRSRNLQLTNAIVVLEYTKTTD